MASLQSLERESSLKAGTREQDRETEKGWKGEVGGASSEHPSKQSPSSPPEESWDNFAPRAKTNLNFYNVLGPWEVSHHVT